MDSCTEPIEFLNDFRHVFSKASEDNSEFSFIFLQTHHESVETWNYEELSLSKKLLIRLELRILLEVLNDCSVQIQAPVELVELVFVLDSGVPCLYEVLDWLVPALSLVIVDHPPFLLVGFLFLSHLWVDLEQEVFVVEEVGSRLFVTNLVVRYFSNFCAVFLDLSDASDWPGEDLLEHEVQAFVFYLVLHHYRFV